MGLRQRDYLVHCCTSLVFNSNIQCRCLGFIMTILIQWLGELHTLQLTTRQNTSKLRKHPNMRTAANSHSTASTNAVHVDEMDFSNVSLILWWLRVFVCLFVCYYQNFQVDNKKRLRQQQISATGWYLTHAIKRIIMTLRNRCCAWPTVFSVPLIQTVLYLVVLLLLFVFFSKWPHFELFS